MPKIVPYEEKKIHLPDCCIKKSHVYKITFIAKHTKKSQSHHVQEAIREYNRSRGR